MIDAQRMVDDAVQNLLASDALTPDTYGLYTIFEDDLEYLVRIVLDEALTKLQYIVQSAESGVFDRAHDELCPREKYCSTHGPAMTHIGWVLKQSSENLKVNRVHNQ